MQAGITPIFKRLWYDWTQQQPGIEPTNPLGQCWVPPIVAFYDQQGLQEEKIAKLIASLKHTMSDQRSANPTFNLALKKLRSDLLETAIINWENLTPPSREGIKKMTNFFCKMHIVVNFASEADKILKLFESNIAEGRNPQALGTTESGSIRLIRTACKFFTSRGCDKSGVHIMWKSYLEKKRG